MVVVTKVIIPNINYNAAIAMMDSGNYEEAIVGFEALDGYKDSTELIEACELEMRKPQHILSAINSAEIGATVRFGEYEQDNDKSNGKELIEWIILAKENNKDS